jgi:hypothetical protein
MVTNNTAQPLSAPAKLPPPITVKTTTIKTKTDK